MDTLAVPDLTHGAIQGNTVRKTNQCPTCGQPLPSGWTSVRPKVLKVGDLILNPATQDVTRGDKDIVLSQKEFRLLEFLMQRAGRIVPRDVLAQSVWQSNGERDPKFDRRFRLPVAKKGGSKSRGQANQDG
jgi:DNA-binding response OmpR family regulator